MRTTLTLDGDVAAKLEADVKESGRSFKETVNYYLRLGLNTRKPARVNKPFKVRARPFERETGPQLRKHLEFN